MSASREKKTRQDLSGSGWNDPKTAREAKEALSSAPQFTAW